MPKTLKSRQNILKNKIMNGIIATSGGTKKEKHIIPSGTHVAICYSMVHIGTVEFEYMGEKKHADKVRLSFELPHEIRKFGEDGFEAPLSISKKYTNSLHEKSNLRKDLEMWRGKSFTEDELKGFDISNLLGKACTLSVIHQTTKAGNDFAKIGGVASLTKGTECPEQFNPSFIFNYENKFDNDWVESQPDWIKDEIKNTPEYFKTMKQ